MSITWNKKSRKSVVHFELNITDKDKEGAGYGYACIPTVSIPRICGKSVRYSYGIARDWDIALNTGIVRAKGVYTSLLTEYSLGLLAVSYLAHTVGHSLCKRHAQLSKEVVSVGDTVTLILRDTRHPYSKLVLLHFTISKNTVTMRSQVGRLLSLYRDTQPQYHDTNLQDFATLVKVLIDELWHYEAQQYAGDTNAQFSHALTVAKFEADKARETKLNISNYAIYEYVEDLELFLLQCCAFGDSSSIWAEKLNNKILELCKVDLRWQVWDALTKGTPHSMTVLHNLSLCPIGIDRQVKGYDLQEVLLQYELFEALGDIPDSCLDGSYTLPKHIYSPINSKSDGVRLDTLGLGEPFTLYKSSNMAYIMIKRVGGYAAIVPYSVDGIRWYGVGDAFALSLTVEVFAMQEGE